VVVEVEEEMWFGAVDPHASIASRVPTGRAAMRLFGTGSGSEQTEWLQRMMERGARRVVGVEEEEEEEEGEERTGMRRGGSDDDAASFSATGVVTRPPHEASSCSADLSHAGPPWSCLGRTSIFERTRVDARAERTLIETECALWCDAAAHTRAGIRRREAGSL
jgi:hypothetical protein